MSGGFAFGIAAALLFAAAFLLAFAVGYFVVMWGLTFRG